MSSNLQETADLVTFTEEILNGKCHFCAVGSPLLNRLRSYVGSKNNNKFQEQ